MSGRIWAQKSPQVWNSSASMAASGSSTSITGGCATGCPCHGYARITGMVISNASSTSRGLKILQSADRGQNWDYVSSFTMSACSGSAFSSEIVGNSVKIEYYTDSAADVFRTNWQMRPI